MFNKQLYSAYKRDIWKSKWDIKLIVQIFNNNGIVSTYKLVPKYGYIKIQQINDKTNKGDKKYTILIKENSQRKQFMCKSKFP